MKKKGTLTLIPTPIDEIHPLETTAWELLNNISGDSNSIVCIEDLKPGRRRWLRWNLPRNQVEDFVLYNEHNHKEQCIHLINELKSGKNVYLMSDGGLPAFCDPGQDLVRVCHKNKIKVTSTPFSNSISLALALSGMYHHQFFFRGFLSNKNEIRSLELKEIKLMPYTQILMDTPYRLKKILSELIDLELNREIFLACDLNSEEEELYFGDPKKILNDIKDFKREFILIINAKN